MAEEKIIVIKNTRFIFKTNLRGELDPNSRYPSTDRVANVVVPPSMVADLEEAGINVRATKPREGEEEGFQPTYHIKVKVSYRDKYGELKPERLWPKVRLYRGINSNPVDLDEESIAMIDEIDVEEISVRLNPWPNNNGGVTLYVRDLSVVQDVDSDPFGDMYGRRDDVEETEAF